MALIMCCYSLDGTIPVIYQEDNHKYSLIERRNEKMMLASAQTGQKSESYTEVYGLGKLQRVLVKSKGCQMAAHLMCEESYI